MNNKEVVHPSGGLANDNNDNTECHGVQHKQIYQHNSFYTLVENKPQPNTQLEDQNGTNDWKTTNKLEGELVMAYDNNARSKTLYQRPFFALCIGPNDSGTDHSIFKLSTKQILITPKYKPSPKSEESLLSCTRVTRIFPCVTKML